MRCYESDANGWMHAWMCDSQKPSQPPKHVYECNLGRNLQGRQGWHPSFDRISEVMKMRKELMRTRDTYRSRRLGMARRQQCGYTATALDVAVHIRLGDQGFSSQVNSSQVNTLLNESSLTALAMIPSLQELIDGELRRNSSNLVMREVRFHVFSETSTLAPIQSGQHLIFPDLGYELHFHPMNLSTASVSTHFLADLEFEDKQVKNIHAVLNADPFTSLDCLAASDALLVAESSFSVTAAAVSSNLKLFPKITGKRPLVWKTMDWVKQLDDYSSVKKKQLLLWHELSSDPAHPFQKLESFRSSVRHILAGKTAADSLVR